MSGEAARLCSFYRLAIVFKQELASHLLTMRHDILKVICPVCTTADFLFNSYQHCAGVGDVADIMVICLLIFPETSYVCYYLAKQIPAHHIYTEKEKMKTKSNVVCSLFQQPSLENDPLG